MLQCSHVSHKVRGAYGIKRNVNTVTTLTEYSLPMNCESQHLSIPRFPCSELFPQFRRKTEFILPNLNTPPNAVRIGTLPETLPERNTVIKITKLNSNINSNIKIMQTKIRV